MLLARPCSWQRSLRFAAALSEWPAADQQPLTEHLQHQTGTHSAPMGYLRIKGGDGGDFRAQPVATLTLKHGAFEKSELIIICHWISSKELLQKTQHKFFQMPIVSEIWERSGARLVVSGERSATNRPKGVRGWGLHACAFRLFGCLEGIAAQPLRYCRLTAHYLHHHQNAATPNKEGKTKQNRKNNQHVRVRGFLLVFLDYLLPFPSFSLLNTDLGN